MKTNSSRTSRSRNRQRQSSVAWSRKGRKASDVNVRQRKLNSESSSLYCKPTSRNLTGLSPNKAEKKGKGKAAKAVVEEADNWLDDDASGVDKGSYEPAMPLLKDDDGSLDPDFAAAEDIDAKREKKRLKKEAKKAAKKEKKLAM